MQANPHYARVIGTRVYSDVSILLYAVLSIREFVCVCVECVVCACMYRFHTHTFKCVYVHFLIY